MRMAHPKHKKSRGFATFDGREGSRAKKAAHGAPKHAAPSADPSFSAALACSLAPLKEAGRSLWRFFLAFVLVVGLLPLMSGDAFAEDEEEVATEEDLDAAEEEAAEDVEEAQLTLDEAEERMEELTAECEELQQEIDEMQEEIDELAAEVLEAQSAMLEGREALGETIAYEYRNSSVAQMLAFLLEAESFSEFLQNLSYLNTIAEYQAEQIAEQEELIENFQSISETLSAQKDEQEEKLAELEEKIDEAEALVEEASSSLEVAEDEQDRIAELQAMADALAEEDEVSEPVAVEEANTINRQEVVSDDTPVLGDTIDVDSDEEDEAAEEEAEAEAEAESEAESESASDAGSDAGSDAAEGDSSSAESGSESGTATESESQAESESESDEEEDDSEEDEYGWRTGIASAYGGETDPYTPNPGITATGATCDDESMGVAIPMSWDEYCQYYGCTVEIVYNGITVYATVNDCGYMGGGSRDLDLQPGVWKAFGFSSCTEWGLRYVKYRFL